MNAFAQIVTICSGISSITALILFFVKPIREKIMGTREIREGQRCLLRADMLRTYYHHNNEDRIRQYEFENFMLEYKAYKALGGNSFIDHVYDEVKTWEVLT